MTFRITCYPFHPIPLHSDIHPLLLHPAVFSDMLHQRLHKLEQASIVYCKQGRDQARECERKQEMHCYCVLRIAFCVLCMYCILQIRNCLLCILYCILWYCELERVWEEMGMHRSSLSLVFLPTQLLDWLCCFAPLWKQLTFPFSKCFFPGLMDSGSLQWLTRLAMQAPLLVFIRSPPAADETNFLRTNQPPQFP